MDNDYTQSPPGGTHIPMSFCLRGTTRKCDYSNQSHLMNLIFHMKQKVINKQTHTHTPLCMTECVSRGGVSERDNVHSCVLCVSDYNLLHIHLVTLLPVSRISSSE